MSTVQEALKRVADEKQVLLTYPTCLFPPVFCFPCEGSRFGTDKKVIRALLGASSKFIPTISNGGTLPAKT